MLTRKIDRAHLDWIASGPYGVGQWAVFSQKVNGGTDGSRIFYFSPSCPAQVLAVAEDSQPCEPPTRSSVSVVTFFDLWSDPWVLLE